MCDPTIRQPGFDLPRQQWFLLNRFRTEQGHCGACRRKWRLSDTDLCPCGETETMSHIVESCPLTKLNGGLSWLYSADKDAVSWLTSYGSRHACEKKIKCCSVVFGVTLRLLNEPSTNSAAALSVTTCWTVVWRQRVDNTWPVAALTARSEVRYRLIIAISAYPTCIRRPR